MNKQNIELEHDQNVSELNNDTSIAIDNNVRTACDTVEDVTTNKKPKAKKTLVVGAKVKVNPDAKHFCDGRGIPDYARTAYVKRVNSANNTVLIETEPDGKELGLLFSSEITLV